MNITVNVDCTPEEARRFMGLPDLTPVHAAYIDRMQSAIANGVTPDMIESMMKSWGPMSEAGITIWRKMIEQMAGGAKG